jgi:hypothetical protein
MTRTIAEILEKFDKQGESQDGSRSSDNQKMVGENNAPLGSYDWLVLDRDLLCSAT